VEFYVSLGTPDIGASMLDAAFAPTHEPLPVIYRRSRRRIYAALAVFCLFVISLTGYSLWRSYNLEHEQAEHFTRELAHAVSVSLAAEFGQIDQALLTIADEASREIDLGGLNLPQLEQLMIRQNSRLHALGGLTINDRSGESVLVNFTAASSKSNVADRSYFIQLRDHPESGLVISNPIKGRLTKNWVIVFARRINSPSSGFAGNVQGFIDLTWFDGYLRAVNVGADGLVSLRSTDFGVIARQPDDTDREIQLAQRSISDEFKRAHALNPDNGTYETPPNPAGPRRIISYTRVPEFPFYVFVGQSKERLMSRWYQEATAFFGIVSVFIVALIGLSIITIRAWERQAIALRQEETARAASEAKSSFLAHMSHELRTPLNVISNYSLLLKEELTDTGQNELVEIVGRIDSARGHLLALISNILDLSKIEADKIDIDIHDVRLGDLVHQAEIAALAISSTNNNQFHVTCAAELESLVITTDGTRMKQCLLNLISNAMKFTKDGVVKLNVHRQGDQIIFDVSDTGIGLTQEQAARLFQPFIQADRTTTRRFGGSGLGLYLTKSFVTILGGTLTVESAPGEGATFTLTLPIKAQVG
jgi:signal transduction histidine kinase